MPGPAAVKLRELSVNDSTFLDLALENCSLCFLVFDFELRCTAVKESYPAPQGLYGKNAHQIFGAPGSQIQSGLEQVRQSGEALRDIEVCDSRRGNIASSRWIFNFFPIGHSILTSLFIGAVFTRVSGGPRSDALAGSLRSRSFSDGDRPLAALSSDCADICDRATELLERSLSLGRRICEMRLDTTMRASLTIVSRRMPSLRTKSPASPPPLQHLDDASASVPATMVGQPIAVEAVPASRSPGHLPTPREMQVVRLLANGRSNKEIAADLGLSIRTVETYRARLMFKLKLRSAADIVRYAIRNRLVEA